MAFLPPALRRLAAASLLAAVSVAAPLHAATVELVTNGTFNTGMSSWTVTNTPNGTTRINTVTSTYDVDGDGLDLNALNLQVGRSGGTGTGGVTLTQTIVVPMHMSLTFTADIMARGGNTSGNLDFGQFSMWFNGTLIDNHAFGAGVRNEVKRSTLSGIILDVLPGTYALTVNVQRGYNVSNQTPLQILDDFSVQATIVPLPASSLLLLGGLAGLGWVRHRRRRVA